MIRLLLDVLVSPPHDLRCAQRLKRGLETRRERERERDRHTLSFATTIVSRVQQCYFQQVEPLP